LRPRRACASIIAMTRRDPINQTDDDARRLARRLIDAARFGALAVNDPGGPAPLVSRVAVAALDSCPHILVSDLSAHSAALVSDPNCALLLGEPGPKGDPLTHPRLTLVAVAGPADKAALRGAWLSRQPKSALWYDFADFRMLRLAPVAVHLNGGFGKAYRLGPDDL